MIYLDNAASSNKKPKEVIDAVNLALTELSTNAGRSGHKLALAATKKVEETREKTADFFNFDFPERVIFTKNCTESLNLAIQGSIKKGGHIITSVMEHNSILRPLYALKKNNIIDLTVLPLDEQGKINPLSLEKAIKKNTYLVAISHTSNVTGATNDIYEIGNLLKGKNIYFLVDGAQSAGYIDIDFKKFNISFLCLPAHKGLLGISGLGLLLIADNIKLVPLIHGGTGTLSNSLIQPHDFPEGYESGTLNIAGICALNSALEYHTKNKTMLRSNMQTIKSEIKKINIRDLTIFSKENDCGIFTFSHKNMQSSFIADILDNKFDIAVRSGLHCAPLIHEFYNPKEDGLTRASFSFFNTIDDVNSLKSALLSLSQ